MAWLLNLSGQAVPGTAFGQPAPTVAEPETKSVQSWQLGKLRSLATWVQQKGGTLSAHFLDLETGLETGAHQTRAVNPASNMKIVTAVLALDKRGSNYSYRTALHGKIGADGVAPTLVLRGDGDPSLTEPDLWRLANALVGRGLKRVDALLVDQSAFDDQFVPPAFEQQPNEWAAFRAPVSAIAVARNTITLNVLDQAPGSPARVWFEPDGVTTLNGSIETVARGKGQNIQLSLSHDKANGLTAQVGGYIAAGLGRQQFSKRVEDPRLVPGLVLAAALKRLGVAVRNVTLGTSHGQPRLTYIASPPLEQLLAAVGKRSDNFSAEMIFKSLSAHGSTPATTPASADMAMRWLADISSLPTETQVRNGSGLFDANRLSAATLVAVLRFAYSEAHLRHSVISQLAVGGSDGTLAQRFRSTAGLIRAKTGTLNSTIALSGYVLRGGRRAPIAFSILVNGISGHHAELRKRIDAVVNEARLSGA